MACMSNFIVRMVGLRAMEHKAVGRDVNTQSGKAASRDVEMDIVAVDESR